MARVAHLLSGLAIGGKERAALRLARRGRSDGHDHRLILFDTAFRNADLDFPPGDVPVHFIHRPPGLSLRFAWLLAGHAAREQLDAIHAHNDTAIVYAAIAAALVRLHGRRVTVVGTFHTWPSHPSGNARRLSAIASRGAVVTAVSGELTQRLLAGSWLSNCKTVWNGVDLAEYTPVSIDEGSDTQHGRVVVGHAGRLDPIKRHVDLIAAARLLKDRPIAFTLVGQGPLRDELHHQSADLPNVTWIDTIGDMPRFFNSIDIFVLCSAHEAAPLVLLEALACGVPAVATGVGGIPHILSAPPLPAAGLVVPPGEPERLAGAIAALSNDPALRRELAQAARRRAESFDFEQEWQTYAALYAGNVA